MAKKLDKETISYRDGLYRALELVEKNGVDGLKEEIAFRNITGVSPLCFSNAEYRKWETCCAGSIAKSIATLAVYTMIDEFDFGEKEAAKFMERFNRYSNHIGEDLVDWEGIADAVSMEAGLTDIDSFVNKITENGKKPYDKVLISFQDYLARAREEI